MFQFGLVDLPGDLGHFTGADSAAQTDDAGVEDFLWRCCAVIALLPVLEFVQKTAVTINRGQGFQQGHIVPIGEKVL